MKTQTLFMTLTTEHREKSLAPLATYMNKVESDLLTLGHRVVQTEIGPKGSSASSIGEPSLDPAEYTVADLRDTVADLQSADLWATYGAEVQGKNRVGAKAVILGAIEDALTG